MALPALLVGLALVFDLFDGRAARALGTDAAFGAQLDSLSDLVSFGVAPALALHTWKLAEATSSRASTWRPSIASTFSAIRRVSS